MTATFIISAISAATFWHGYWLGKRQGRKDGIAAAGSLLFQGSGER